MIDWHAGALDGNTVSKQTAIAEFTADGFELGQTVDDWALGAYCLVFRKPPIESARR